MTPNVADPRTTGSGWALLFSPRMLFLFGTLQALTPYIFWYVEGTNPNYTFDVTYIPLQIFVIGFAAFCLGTVLATKAQPNRIQNGISLTQTRKWTAILLTITFVQILAALSTFGTVPLVAYLSGDMNVNDMQTAQLGTGYGQLGTLMVTISFLNGMLLLLIVESIRARRQSRLLVLTAVLLLLFGSSFSGKRQGAVMTVVFLASGLALRFGNPLGAFLRVIGLPYSRSVRSIAILAVTSGVVLFVGVMPALRTGETGNVNPMREMESYLSSPLMNYEAECGVVGLAPYKLNFIDPLRYMLPNRSSLTNALPFNELPSHPEPNSPSGFYSQVHWGLGAAGAWAFAALCGFLAQWSFNRAHFSMGHLLIYSQVSWALLSAHSYNHFLNLNYVPVPVLGFAVFSWFVAHVGARKPLSYGGPQISLQDIRGLQT